jgi:hypothetical protein
MILVVLVLLLELPRLKILWTLLTKRKASAKSSKPRMLKVETEDDYLYCQTGHTRTTPLYFSFITCFKKTFTTSGSKCVPACSEI